MKKKLFSRKQFKKRKQLILVVIVIILLCLFWLYIIDDICSPRHTNYEYTYKEYVISSGERLWDIAKEELEINSYYEGEDIRQIVFEIQKDNNINSQIYEGQVIKIRIKKDELSTSTDQSDIDNTSSQNKLNQN